MKTNDIKKGMVVKLHNGWYGIMADNMRGNTRLVSSSPSSQIGRGRDEH